MSKMIGVGLVGCGGMGSRVAQGCVTSGLGRMTAVFDVDSERNAKAAERFAAAACKSEAELLARDDVDAVIVGTPPYLHAEQVLRAVGAGKPTYVEKPMALSSADCDAMIAAAKKTGVTIMVGQVLRYIEPLRAILRVAATGVWGRPLHADMWRASAGGYVNTAPWRVSLAKSGGYLYEVSVHELDFIRCLMGEPTDVHAVLQKKLPSPHEIEDAVSAHIRFESGASASFLGGTGVPVGGTGFCLYFERARVRSIAGYKPAELSIEVLEGAETRPQQIEFSSENGVDVETRLWLESLRDGTPPPIPGEEGRRSVALVEAAYRSAKTGKLVQPA